MADRAFQMRVVPLLLPSVLRSSTIVAHPRICISLFLGPGHPPGSTAMARSSMFWPPLLMQGSGRFACCLDAGWPLFLRTSVNMSGQPLRDDDFRHVHRPLPSLPPTKSRFDNAQSGMGVLTLVRCCFGLRSQMNFPESTFQIQIHTNSIFNSSTSVMHLCGCVHGGGHRGVCAPAAEIAPGRADEALRRTLDARAARDTTPAVSRGVAAQARCRAAVGQYPGNNPAQKTNTTSLLCPLDIRRQIDSCVRALLGPGAPAQGCLHKMQGPPTTGKSGIRFSSHAHCALSVVPTCAQIALIRQEPSLETYVFARRTSSSTFTHRTDRPQCASLAGTVGNRQAPGVVYQQAFPPTSSANGYYREIPGAGNMQCGDLHSRPAYSRPHIWTRVPARTPLWSCGRPSRIFEKRAQLTPRALTSNCAPGISRQTAPRSGRAYSSRAPWSHNLRHTMIYGKAGSSSLRSHGGLGAPGPKGRDAMRRRGEAASLSCRVARRVVHFITVVRNLATGTASPSVSGYIGETLCNVETRQAASRHAGEDIYATVTDCPARFSWRYDLSIHRKLNFTRSQQISGGQRKGRSSRPGLTRNICAEPTQAIARARAASQDGTYHLKLNPRRWTSVCGLTRRPVFCLRSEMHSLPRPQSEVPRSDLQEHGLKTVSSRGTHGEGEASLLQSYHPISAQTAVGRLCFDSPRHRSWMNALDASPARSREYMVMTPVTCPVYRRPLFGRAVGPPVQDYQSNSQLPAERHDMLLLAATLRAASVVVSAALSLGGHSISKEVLIVATAKSVAAPSGCHRRRRLAAQENLALQTVFVEFCCAEHRISAFGKSVWRDMVAGDKDVGAWVMSLALNSGTLRSTWRELGYRLVSRGYGMPSNEVYGEPPLAPAARDTEKTAEAHPRLPFHGARVTLAFSRSRSTPPSCPSELSHQSPFAFSPPCVALTGPRLNARIRATGTNISVQAHTFGAPLPTPTPTQDSARARSAAAVTCIAGAVERAPVGGLRTSLTRCFFPALRRLLKRDPAGHQSERRCSRREGRLESPLFMLNTMHVGNATGDQRAARQSTRMSGPWAADTASDVGRGAHLGGTHITTLTQALQGRRETVSTMPFSPLAFIPHPAHDPRTARHVKNTPCPACPRLNHNGSRGRSARYGNRTLTARIPPGSTCDVDPPEAVMLRTGRWICFFRALVGLGDERGFLFRSQESPALIRLPSVRSIQVITESSVEAKYRHLAPYGHPTCKKEVTQKRFHHFVALAYSHAK
ncbi:hypothetical protein PHLGIDRAFT_11383 [Phlebiopsis gigantea 11061_1 CR5-6]|uniref:Uncharacterized protein n=1 Tax=Phlebiopsis gigantea (strain 11061_1 CR5-6) TaxID=745531 RepID=A0A0C3SBT6_PHLG1|nr:hypothetical protein PHLGIDRAFT_11383 [Phlebiopsis gigantea 11061_1 CR5-6]